MGVSLQLLHMGRKEEVRVPPKGCMAIRVGTEGEEQKRFVVPVMYLNHPLFLNLLKEAEEEYGFDHKGAITIPCHVEHFRHIQGIIERENATAGGYGGHHHDHHHHDHHFHLAGCFRA
ncbi:auxin-responsive protein SAUR32 [Typha latifolia]|uniref:auxin-responsive protein SAUR32 n=1 Tax=Typha latifolia TaxID=4733 RepID=UPI003C2C0E80